MDVDWQQAAAVIAVITGVLVSVRYLSRLLRYLRGRLSAMFGINALKEEVELVQQDLCKVHDTLKVIVSELRPNGGASIRDSLNRIELRQVLQEQRQKAILTDMSVGVFETSTTGDVVWVNRKYLRLTGRAPSEVVGSGWMNTIANRDRERVQGAWARAIAEEREFEEEYTVVTPDQQRCLVTARTYKMVGQHNEPLGFMGILTPVSPLECECDECKKSINE